MKRRPIFTLAIVALFATSLAACGDDSGGDGPVCGNNICETGELTGCPEDCPVQENCTNTIDDDDDGLIDCADPDCIDDPACDTTTTETNCSDGVDNDGDDLIDCDDDDCANDAACQATEGVLSCSGLDYCSYCCGQDTTCAAACEGVATTEAITANDAIYTCLGQHCQTECSGSDQQACQTCAETNCSTQIDACTWGTNGTGGCYTLATCTQSCGQPLNSGTTETCPDESANSGLFCYQDCFSAADDNAYDLYMTFQECGLANCETECNGTDPDACQTCVQTNCSTEMNACSSD